MTSIPIINKGKNNDYLFRKSKTFCQLHHIFPTRTGVNSARNNYPFAEIPDNQTAYWYYRTQNLPNIPNTQIDQYSERYNQQFEPREDHKGNVARAMFYFYTMYEEFALEADPQYFEAQRETLCQWHNQDPVDWLEWNRTHLIAQYQDNLPNPFIIDCTIPARTYCPNTQFDCPAPSIYTSTEQPTQASKPIIYPNPVTNYLTIETQQNTTITLTNINGKQLLRKEINGSIQINLTQYPKGVYILTIINISYKILK